MIRHGTSLLALLILVLAASSAQAQTVVYVDQGAAGAGDGSSWADAYPFLQDAFDEVNANASTDYEIRVAEGAYYPDEDADGDHAADDSTEVFTLSRDGVNIRGGYPSGGGTPDPQAHPTVLSGDITQDDATGADGVTETTDDQNGNNSTHVLHLDGAGSADVTSTTVIEGVTVTAGQADANLFDLSSDRAGGGLYCDGSGSTGRCNPVLTSVSFFGNTAAFGGALYNDGRLGGVSSPAITHATFSGNAAVGNGGAIANNGGIGESSPAIRDVTFTGNSAGAVSNPSEGAGGAIFNSAFSVDSLSIEGTSSPMIVNATFSNNAADIGGAIHSTAGNGGVSNPRIINTTFFDNTADDLGGAIFSNGGGSEGGNEGESSPIIANSVFSGNVAGFQGGAMYNRPFSGGVVSPQVANTTFAGNSADGGGGAIANVANVGMSEPQITNVILSGNAAGGLGGSQILNLGSPVVLTVRYTLVEGGVGGPGIANLDGASTTDGGGNLQGDPQFADADGDDDTAGTEDDDLRLRGPGGGSSPAIDAGDNSAVPDTLTQDLAGLDRFQDVPEITDTGSGSAPIVDLGAYESDGSPLPVELARFTARADGRDAVLWWRTLTETGSDGFRIERRRPNADVGATGRSPGWKKVAFVESRAEGGTSQEPLRYQFRAADLEYGAHTFRLVQRDLDGDLAPVGSKQTVEIGLSGAYDLSEAYPNPFRERATLALAVREAQEVSVSVYDALGREVRVLREGPMAAQEIEHLTLRADGLASGVYFVRVVGEDFAATRRVVVVR